MKKLGLILLSLLLFVLLVLPCEAVANSDYAPGQLLVKFAEGFDPASVLSDIDGGYVSHSYANLPQWKLVELPQGLSVKSAQQAYISHMGIIQAEPNYRYYLTQTMPNDPGFADQWALYNMGQTGGTPGADISAPEAWEIRTSAADIVVAVLDTGIDYNHPDLIGNMWTSAQGPTAIISLKIIMIL